MEKLPQRLVNVSVRDREAIEHAVTVWAAVDESPKRSRAAAACWSVPPEPSRSCA